MNQSQFTRFVKSTVVGLALLGTLAVNAQEGGKGKQAKPNQQETSQQESKAQTAEGEVAKSKAVNINSSSLEELMSLPRVGPAIGGRILAFRKEHGGFKNLEELMAVRGIGPKTFDRLKGSISL